ncbi:LemA family protein [Fulvimarina sp. MAC8]|uniref:LemA family protein n=1 Tax=Fulvimarina sp. MAC8 TaxID=3162874 RepID=UPI0032EB553D
MAALAFILPVLLLGGIVGVYIILFNGLRRAETRVEQSWAGVEVQLKRRHDLVPTLVQSVRRALDHEETIFRQVTEARQKAVEALAGHDPETMAKAESLLGSALRGLTAWSEDNPEITSTENVAILQRQLEETEDQISAARRLHNGNVQDLNQRIVTFPGNLVASLHSITRAKPFEMNAGERISASQRPVIEF